MFGFMWNLPSRKSAAGIPSCSPTAVISRAVNPEFAIEKLGREHDLTQFDRGNATLTPGWKNVPGQTSRPWSNISGFFRYIQSFQFVATPSILDAANVALTLGLPGSIRLPACTPQVCSEPFLVLTRGETRSLSRTYVKQQSTGRSFRSAQFKRPDISSYCENSRCVQSSVMVSCTIWKPTPENR